MKKIYIWGTGCTAGDLLDRHICAELVAAFVDSRPNSDLFLGIPVVSPEELSKRDYDLIVVASRSSSEISETCLRLGIELEKVLFTKNTARITDCNISLEQARAVLGQKTLDQLRETVYPVKVVRREQPRLPESEISGDYVRMRSLELICQRLETVPGCAAELGVYKGNFARCINYLMPNRTLYLFDTFEGFSPEEALQEQRSGNCDTAFLQAHKNTAADAVLKKMPHPEKLVIMQGLFPDSLQGLEERFAFVSLDVDFEESTYAGLSYFVSRMNPGGYIFLHDYNSNLNGVRKALERYEHDRGILLHCFPLCDVCGTMAISF